MVLSKIKEVVKHLNFVGKSFTKGGFRHVMNYISGLIALTKKTAKKIAEACQDEKHSSALNRLLVEAKFNKELLEKHYFKKIRYIFKNFDVFLLIDDTLVERKGEKIENSQMHFNHSTNSYVQGHQFFMALLYTPFLQIPLFPELYSKSTDSKIEMAKNLVTKLQKAKIKIHTMMFDSWYSDKKLIKKNIASSIRVICAIKTNRNVKIFGARNKFSLAFISKKTRLQKLEEYKIDKKNYGVWSKKIYLNKLPLMRLVISHEKVEKKITDHTIHIISTDIKNTAKEILETYKIRWRIETYHRDIKQNLGFAKFFFRKKEGIVRHTIFIALTYAALNLFMYSAGKRMTIGNCCDYLRDKAQADLIEKIIVIEDKKERQKMFEKVFIRKTR